MKVVDMVRRRVVPLAALFVVISLLGCGAPSATDPSADVATSTGGGAADSADDANNSDAAPADSKPAANDDAAKEEMPAEEGSADGAADKPAAEPDEPKADEEEPAASTSDDAAKQANSGATLSGRVTFDGTPPERRPINMSKDPMCIKLHGGEEVLDEAVLISDEGGVKNAFVYIRRGAPDMEYPVPEEPVVLDQKNCAYVPRVGGMLVGQKLLVSNSDPVTHNVRSYPIRNRAFNFGQPAGTGARERIFDEPEREIEVQCDIHPWMHAYVFVMDHPFFNVSAEDGTYAIEGLPPGEYTLAIWHEKLGKDQQTVTVGDDDLGDVNFVLKP